MKQLFSKKQVIFKTFFPLSLLVFLILFFKAWQNTGSLIAFIGAYILGIFLLYIDEQYLYKFYVEKIDSSFENNSHLSALASRNFLFLLILPLLSIFVLTSSGSILGIALILAINFYLLIEMWQLRHKTLLFKERFLSMFKIEITAELIRKVCWAGLIYFIFLLVILLF